MASGLWGFENVPELYVERHQANPIGESIGGGIGQIFAAVAAGKRADQQRALALQRMQQEQDYHKAQMGLERDKMGAEQKYRESVLGETSRHNKQSEFNDQNDYNIRKDAADLALAKDTSARQAAPITGAIESIKDISQEPEMQGVGSLLRTGEQQAKESNQVTVPQFATRGGFRTQALQDAFARGAEPRMETVSPEQFNRDIAPNMKDASGAVSQRKAQEKMNAASAGRTTQSDALERIILKGQVDAIIAKAKGGKPLDAIDRSIIERDPNLKAQVLAEQNKRGIDLGAAVGEIRDLRMPGMPPTRPEPNQTPANPSAPTGPTRMIKGRLHQWDGKQWVPEQ